MASPRPARQRAHRLPLRAARVRGTPWLTVTGLHHCSTAATPAGRKVARMPHLPFLAIAAIVVAVPTWLLAGPNSRVSTEFEFTGSPQDYVVPSDVCRFGSRSSERQAVRVGTSGTPGAGAQATAEFSVTPGEILRVRVGGWGGEAVGRRQEPAAGTVAAPAARRSTAAGKPAPAAVERPTSVTVAMTSSTGSSSEPEDRAAPAARSAARSDRRRQRRRSDREHEGFAVLGSANPATGGKGGTQTSRRRPGPERFRSLGHGDGGLPRVGRKRRRRDRQRRRRRWRRALRRRWRRLQRIFSGGHGGGGSGFGPASDELPSRCRRWPRAREDQLRPRHPLLSGSRHAKADV